VREQPGAVVRRAAQRVQQQQLRIEPIDAQAAAAASAWPRWRAK
jgi:hypothetical protein